MMCSASMWRRFCRINSLSRCGTSSYDVYLRTPARMFDASNLQSTHVSDSWSSYSETMIYRKAGTHAVQTA